MSNTFCLPVAVSIAPRKWINAILIALYCAPLSFAPMILNTAFGLPLALLFTCLVFATLAFELHRQRHANTATRLEATATDNWLLHRAHCDNTQSDKVQLDKVQPDKVQLDKVQPDKVQLITHADFRFFIMLRMKHNHQKFRLIITPHTQPHDQLHRLRVMLKF